MYNQLPAAIADVTDTLNIDPSSYVKRNSKKKQTLHEFDDSGVSVVSESAESTFEIEVKWDYLTAVEQDFVFELWHEPLKANGTKNTFYWKDPLEDKTYVARFLTEISSSHYPHNHIGVKNIVLSIEGLFDGETTLEGTIVRTSDSEIVRTSDLEIIRVEAA